MIIFSRVIERVCAFIVAQVDGSETELHGTCLKLAQKWTGRAALVACLLLGCDVGMGDGFAQQCAAPPAGLVAWWKGDGNADGIQGTYNGTLKNGATFATGFVGQAFSFDGVDDYFVVPDNEAQRSPHISIEGWFKIGRGPPEGQRFILVAKHAEGFGWYVALPASRKPEFVLNRDSDPRGTNVISSAPILVDQWTHLACTYDGAEGRIYVNGVHQGTANFPGGYKASPFALTLGKASWYEGEFAPVQVDEFSFYNRALTDPEIFSVYSSGSAGKCHPDALSITSQPTNQTVLLGSNPQFTFSTFSSDTNISYQWFFNGVSLAGQTNSVVSLPNVHINQAGQYFARASNRFGSVTSSNALLVVVDVHALEPSNADTDGDGVTDYVEIFTHHSNPFSVNTSGDGIPDNWKVQFGISPIVANADTEIGSTGVTYRQVYQHNLANPNRAVDLRNPGAGLYEIMNAGQQTNRFFYDKNDRFTGAEYSRGVSISYRYDANGNLTNQMVLSRAAETNGLPVFWLAQHGFANGPGVAYRDADGDGWSNYQEWKAASDPQKMQSVPSLSSNPGMIIGSLSFPFTPTNFVTTTGQLDGLGAEEIIIGADGNPGTNSNFLIVLTQGPTSWSTQRVDVGTFGVTSIAIGQPTNRPTVGIYVGLRGTDGNGQVMEFVSIGGLWHSNLVAMSTNEAAIVGGIRRNGDMLANLANQGMVGALWSLTSSSSGWNASLMSSNAAHRGVLGHGLVQSRAVLDASIRLLDKGGIELIGREFEVTKNGVVLPSNAILNPVTGKWHFLSPSPGGWEGVQQYFKGYHGDIVLPKSAEENVWVFNTFHPLINRAPYEIWLGLYFERFTPNGPYIPHLADGKVAPHRLSGNGAFYEGYANWRGDEPQFGSDNRRFIHTEFMGALTALWSASHSVGGSLYGVGEVTGVTYFTNRWLITEPGLKPLNLNSKGSMIKTGYLRSGGTNSLLYFFVDDKGTVTNTLDGSDSLVLVEYQVLGNEVSTQILTNVAVGNGPLAPSIAIATADFLNSGFDYVFTSEPSGEIYSWSPSNVAGDLLSRQLFSSDYAGMAWHDLSRVKLASGGQGLIGLMIDPNQNATCNLIFWPPQSSLELLPQGVPQTAPFARVLPTIRGGTNQARIQIRIWDGQGNRALPFFEYRLNTSSSWRSLTNVSINGFRVTESLRIEALPTGSTHTFDWNVGEELGYGLRTNVQLRVAAKDVTLRGEWSEPMNYQIETTANPDSDGDGLPDQWERDFFGNLAPTGNADFDGDGHSNYQEYLAGTDPRDANSSLKVSGTIRATTIVIQWADRPGRTLILEAADGIEGGVIRWEPVQTNSPPYRETMTTNPRFFRLRLQ